MKSLLKFILNILTILCAAFVCYMFFSNALYDSNNTFIAKDLAMGKVISETTILGQTTTLKLNKSYLVMVAYFLPLVAAILSFIMIFLKGRIITLLFSLLSFASFVVAFVLLLNLGQIVSVESSITGIVNATTTSNLEFCSFTKEAVTSLIVLLFGSCFTFSKVCLSLS